MDHSLGAAAGYRGHRSLSMAGLIALALALLAMLVAPNPAQGFGSMSFPVAQIDASSTYTRANTAITFDGSRSYGIELSVPQQWDWNFGDGATASGTTVQHAFTKAGQYTVTLTVTDQYGTTGSATQIVAIWEYPTAVMTTSATTGRAPLTVSFDGSGSTSDGWALTSYTWDFGDGTTATGVTASHTYTIPGRYTASLTVKNLLGWASSTYATINATELMAPPTNLTATSPTRGNVTLTWTNRMTALHSTEVQRCSGSRCTTFATVTFIPTTWTTYSEAGLKSGASFRYRLKLTDIAGAVGYSSIATVKVR